MNTPAIRHVTPEALGFPAQEVATPKRLYPYRCDHRHRPFAAVPLLGSGTCLSPWFEDGDFCWYTPGVEPQHNDLVAVDLELGHYPVNPETGKREDSGQRTRIVAVKLYQVAHGFFPQLVCNQGAVALSSSKHRILGTITAWRRPGWWKRPRVRDMQFSSHVDVWAQGFTGRPGFPGSNREV